MMRSFTHHAVSFALLLCGMMCSALAQTPQTPQTPKKNPGGIIAGKVTIKGKAAPGIVVGVRVGQPMTGYEPTFKGTTDQDGKYRIVDVLPGSYDIAPVAPAYVVSDAQSGRGKMVVLAEGESVDGIDFALVRGGVITGKVTDADGRPVIEQRVSLISADPQTNPRAVYSFSGVQTDDRGIYRMFGLAAGSYKVSVGQGEDRFYTSVSGRPVYKQTFYPDVADANKATIVEVTEGSETPNVDIALGRTTQTYAASGRVINGENGKPIANVRFGLQYMIDGQRRQFMGASAFSNTQGDFKIEGLVPGKYAIFISPQQDGDIHGDAVTFEVLDQDITELVIKSSSGISVAGTVVLENIEDKSVLARFSQLKVTGYVQSETPTGNVMHSATINPDGSFVLKGLEPGMAYIQLGSPQDYSLLKGFAVSRTERDGVIQPRGIEIKNGDQVSGVKVVVSYGNATVHGVVKVENGTLPDNARFYIQVTKPGEQTPAIRSPQVDARGHFMMEGIPAGTYVFIVTVVTPQNVTRVPPPRVRQQVSVVDGVVNDITLIVDLSQNSGPPSQ